MYVEERKKGRKKEREKEKRKKERKKEEGCSLGHVCLSPGAGTFAAVCVCLRLTTVTPV